MLEVAKIRHKSILVIENDKESGAKTARDLKRAISSLHCNRAMVNSLEDLQSDALESEVAAIIFCDWWPDRYGLKSIASTSQMLPNVPILVVGTSDCEDARITAFDNGADHYVSLPCSNREIISRIKVLLRRGEVIDDALTISDLKVWIESRIVLRSGHTIKLSSKEMDILLYLAENKNKPVSRADILKNVFRLDFEPGTNAVEVHIHRLRQKIDSGHPTRLLNTVRGVGYVLG